MKYLAIDTESNGLFRHRDEAGKVVPSDADGQPHMAELAMVYLDDDFTSTMEQQFYFRPTGWEMTAEATAINGLTTDFLKEFGEDMRPALDAFTAAVGDGRVVIAFNAQHDLRMMRASLRRSEMDDLFMLCKNICVMRGCHPLGIQKANGKGGFPQLADACRHFDIVMPEAHNALDDARAAAEIARHLRRLEMLPEAMVHLAKNRG